MAAAVGGAATRMEQEEQEEEEEEAEGGPQECLTTVALFVVCSLHVYTNQQHNKASLFEVSHCVFCAGVSVGGPQSPRGSVHPAVLRQGGAPYRAVETQTC